MCGTVCGLSCATAARAGDDAASLVSIPLLFSSAFDSLLFCLDAFGFLRAFKLFDSMRGFVSRLAGGFNFSLLPVAKPNRKSSAQFGGRRRRIYYLPAINFSLNKQTTCLQINVQNLVLNSDYTLKC
jgi:hypothetical protein